MRLTSFLAALAVTLLIAVPTYAADLTRGEIRNFIDAFKELRVAGEEFEAEANQRMQESGPVDPARPFSSAVITMREVGFDEIDDIVEDHDFDDAEEWADVGDRIMNAYAANSMRTEGPGMNAQVEQVMKMLEDNPNIPQAQRDQIMAQLKAAQGTAAASDEAPTADQLLVKEYEAELDAAFQ